MKRFALYFLVSLVSFVIGAAASFGWNYLKKPAASYDCYITRGTASIPSTVESNERKYHRGVARLAERIISREVTFGDGAEIGEKVVAVFPGNAFSLLWTENDEMCEVEASSLQDIFEYRKDFKR